MASLELEGVTKNFGETPVIQGVDLKVDDGEFVVFVGPSGCGKSTLLRMIAGLDGVTTGKIRIGEQDVVKLTPGERGIAMVFQSYALYPHMSVAKNLSFGLENQKLARADIDAKVLEAARMLAMEPYLQRFPRELSGGQRQRVAIGRTIVRNPKVFLFDEPLSNLDAALRVQTRAEIARLHKRLGATMIYVTHDQVEAMTMADRIVVLNGGRIEQFGTPENLFAHPANKFVAGFIGSPRMNFVAGSIAAIDGDTTQLDVPGFGPLAVRVDLGGLGVGAPIEIGIRPQYFVVDGPGATAQFKVEYAESIGTETFVYGTVVGPEVDAIVHIASHRKFDTGALIPLGVAPQSIHVFSAATGAALAPLLE